MSEDTKLLAAWTPQRYAGDYPPYINLTMARMMGGVMLATRLPTSFGAPPGASSNVQFTREMWREFVKMIKVADKVFEASDELDSLAL